MGAGLVIGGLWTMGMALAVALCRAAAAGDRQHDPSVLRATRFDDPTLLGHLAVIAATERRRQLEDVTTSAQYAEAVVFEARTRRALEGPGPVRHLPAA